jgi:hypothetical protein
MIRFSTKAKDDLLKVTTDGLQSLSMPEIEVAVRAPTLVEAAKGFLSYVADYLLANGKPISPGETLSYGYWLTKFEFLSPGLLEVWEYNALATEFLRGASLTLTYWQEQHSVCQKYDAEFRPPRPDQLTVVSEGVLDGLPVQGIRYLAPEGMSGWWITSDRYSGNISTLRHEHTYHVTAIRPDLAKFIALPVGFRYDLSSHEDVWFDRDVRANR